MFPRITALCLALGVCTQAASAAPAPSFPAHKPAELSQADWDSLKSAAAKAFGLTHKISADAPDIGGDRFGTSVAIAGDTLVVGVPRDTVGGKERQGSAYVFKSYNGNWTFEQRIVAPDGSAFDEFGSAVAISPGLIAVGAPLDDGAAGSDQGAAYVFKLANGAWNLASTVTASDASAGDHFGESLATTSTTLVVGAPEDDSAVSVNQGAAYVFTYAHGSVAEQQKLVATDGAASDFFGRALAISGDRVAIGAPGDDGTVGQAPDEGSVHVFTRANAAWSLEGKVVAPASTGSDEFGTSVALFQNMLVVGADEYANNQGIAFLYTRANNLWNATATLTAADASAGDFFGSAVALSGTDVIVTARTEVAPGSQHHGAAYVFRPAKGIWTQFKKIIAPDGAASDYAGWSVAYDGTTAIVGGPQDDIGSAQDAGSAWVHRNSAGNWNDAPQKLTASDGADNDRFGFSVAIAGAYALIGVPNDEIQGRKQQGSAYLFKHSAQSWAPVQKLVAADGATAAKFGGAVDLYADYALVGAPGANAAYLFKRNGETWSEVQKLASPTPGSNEVFGHSVQLGNGLAAVGAPGYTTPNLLLQGAVYIFRDGRNGWKLESTLLPKDPGATDIFGQSLSLSGNALLIGAPGKDVGADADRGSAYLFTFDAPTSPATWSETLKLAPAVGQAGDWFGMSVAVDGDFALVGSPYDDVGTNLDQGSVSAFRRVQGTWSQASTVVAPQGQAADLFGSSLSLEQSVAIAGALGAGAADAGAAYVFKHDGQAWAHAQTLAPLDGLAQDDFGSAVALSGNAALVGAPRDDIDLKVDQGSAYLFYDLVGTYDDAPVADAQSVTVPASATNIVLTGSDAEGALLTFEVMSQPAKGVLSGNAPVLTFTPNVGAAGPASFTFRVNDGAQNSAIATVSLTLECAAGDLNTDGDDLCNSVDPDDDGDGYDDASDPCPLIQANTCAAAAPVAQAASYTTTQNTPVATTLVATDPDGDVPVYSIVKNPTYGTLSGSGANRTYTPNAGFKGSDAFSFRAYDGEQFSNVAIVSITVDATDCAALGGDTDGDGICDDNDSDDDNDGIPDGSDSCPKGSCPADSAPVVANAGTSTLQGTPVSVALTATDPQNDPLEFFVMSLPTNGTLSGQAPALIYTPNPQFLGTDTFTFRAFDGQNYSNVATYGIYVSACDGNDADNDNDNLCNAVDPCVNDAGNTCPAAAPVAQTQGLTVVKGGQVSFAFAATSPVSRPITSYSVTTQPTKGTVSSGSTANRVYTAGQIAGSDTFAFTATDSANMTSTPATINVSIVADCSASGGDADGDSICDGSDPCLGSANNTCPAAAPVAQPQSLTVVKGLQVTFSFSAISPANRPIAAYSVVNAPTKGTVTGGSAASRTYTAGQATGTDSFTFTATDTANLTSGLATISVNIVADCASQGGDADDDGFCDASDPCPDAQNTCAAAAPFAVAQNLTVVKGGQVSFTLAATSPVNRPIASYAIATQPTKGMVTGGNTASRVYTAGMTVGTDSFTFTGTDIANLTSAAATVNVNIVADCAVQGGDADGDGLCDATDPCLADAMNTCPGAAPIAQAQSLTVIKGGQVSFALAATSPANHAITAYAVTSQPTKGMVSSGSTANRVYTAGQTVGTDSFAFTATDTASLTSVPATVNVTIVADCSTQGGDADNDGLCDNTDPCLGSVQNACPAAAPVAQPQALTVVKGGTVSFSFDAKSPANRPIVSYAIVLQASSGVVSGGTTANRVYTAGPNVGTDTFTFTATDSAGMTSAPATVTVTITADCGAAGDADNDGICDGDDPCVGNAQNTCPAAAPIAQAQTLTVLKGAQVSFAFAASSPANRAIASYAVVSQPTKGSVSSGTTANRVYVAGPTIGTDSLTFTATDSANLTSPAAMVSVNIVADCTGQGDDADGDGLCDASDPCLGSAQNTCPASAPVAQSQGLTVVKGAQLSFAFSATSPVNRAITSYAVASAPTKGSVSAGTTANRVYTAGQLPGTDTFTFTATDSAGFTSAPATVTVTIVSDCSAQGGDADGDGLCDVSDPCVGSAQNTCAAAAPIAQAQNLTVVKGGQLSFAFVATSPAARPITAYTVASQPTKGSVSGGTTANRVYTAGQQPGLDSFTFTATDSANLTSGPATINVNIVADCSGNGGDADGDGLCDTNDPCLGSAQNTCATAAPVAQTQSLTVVKGGQVSFALAATSPANRAIASYAIQAQPAKGTVSSGTTANRVYTAGQTIGADSFTFIATDTANLSSAPATVNVMIVSDCAAQGGDADNDGLCDDSDPCPANADPLCGTTAPDLVVTVSNETDFVQDGQQVTWLATFENEGSAAATSVQLSAALSANMTAVAWTCASTVAGGCPAAAGNGPFQWTTGLAAGGAVTVELTGVVVQQAGNDAFVSATATANLVQPADSDGTDNAATDEDPVAPDGLFKDSFENP